MADRVAGYAPTVTVAGNFVTFSPGHLDKEWAEDTILTDGSHYLYNITTGDTKAIISRAGTEFTGYTFGVAAIGAWASGNRVCPIRQNVGAQNNTLAAATAAAANGDTILAASGSTIFGSALDSWNGGALTTKVCNIWGLFSRRRTLLGVTGVTYGIGFSGDLSGQATQVTIRNLTITGVQYGVYFRDTSLLGGGVRVTRCRFVGCFSYGIIMNGIGKADSVQADNNEVLFSGITGIYGGIRGYYYNNVGFGNITSAFDNALLANIWTNNVGALNAYANTSYRQTANGIFTYCASTDSSLPAGLGNLVSANFDAMRFFGPTASPGRPKHHFDFRISWDSILRGAGNLAAGVPTLDSDLNIRPNPPSIGAFEPYAAAYAPSTELIRSVNKRGAIA